MIARLQQTKLHLADVVARQKSMERQIEAARQELAKAEGGAPGIASEPRGPREGCAGAQACGARKARVIVSGA
jgi:hypothetical protein